MEVLECARGQGFGTKLIIPAFAERNIGGILMFFNVSLFLTCRNLIQIANLMRFLLAIFFPTANVNVYQMHTGIRKLLNAFLTATRTQIPMEYPLGIIRHVNAKMFTNGTPDMPNVLLIAPRSPCLQDSLMGNMPADVMALQNGATKIWHVKVIVPPCLFQLG